MLAMALFMLNFWNIWRILIQGPEKKIEEKGLSVRRNTLGIGQAVHVAGEQSCMKSAKTAGGIRQFSTNEAAVAKWVYNLVSGRPVDDVICDSLLRLEKDGIGLMESFEEHLTTDPTTATFFSPLKRNKYKSWKDSAKKIVIKKDGKVKEFTFQRDILGILVNVAHSYQNNSGIDIDSVLCHPLAPVSVPLSTPDGSIRKTVKSKLFKAAMSDLSVVTDEDLPGSDR